MDRKREQLKIILSTNPCEDEYHTWVRCVDDIRTLEEAISDPDYKDYEEYTPDWNRADAIKAISDGRVMVFSSNPIGQGTFISPSRMEAKSYSGNGEVYSELLKTEDVAWIDPTQGQVAKVD